jgi:hypothetical protein
MSIMANTSGIEAHSAMPMIVMQLAFTTPHNVFQRGNCHTPKSYWRMTKTQTLVRNETDLLTTTPLAM